MVAASESHLSSDTGLRPAAVLRWAGEFVEHIVEIGCHISNFTQVSSLAQRSSACGSLGRGGPPKLLRYACHASAPVGMAGYAVGLVEKLPALHVHCAQDGRRYATLSSYIG